MKKSAHTNWIMSMIELSNERIMSGSFDTSIRVWHLDASSGIKLVYKQELDAEVCSLVRLGSNRVAIGLHDKTIQVFNYENRVFETEFYNRLDGHKGIIRTLANINDTYLISGAEDSKLIMWNINTREIHHLGIGHRAPLWSIVFASNQLFSSSTDKTIIVWKLLDENKLLVKFKTLSPKSSVYTLVILTNGDLASGGGNGPIEIWNSRRNFTLKETLSKNNNNGFVWSLDAIRGGYLVSGAKDSTIKVWNSSMKLVQTLSQHEDQVRCVRVLENGDLIGGTHDGAIGWWKQS